MLDATCTTHTIMYEVLGETLADKNRRERYGVEGRVVMGRTEEIIPFLFKL